MIVNRMIVNRMIVNRMIVNRVIVNGAIRQDDHLESTTNSKKGGVYHAQAECAIVV